MTDTINNTLGGDHQPYEDGLCYAVAGGTTEVKIPTELERLAGEVSAKRTELTEATHIAARVPHIQNELNALVAKLKAELPESPADEITNGLETEPEDEPEEDTPIAAIPENGYAAHY